MQTKHLYFSDLSAVIELISLFGGTEMKVCYNKLWKLLIDKGMKKVN